MAADQAVSREAAAGLLAHDHFAAALGTELAVLRQPAGVGVGLADGAQLGVRKDLQAVRVQRLAANGAAPRIAPIDRLLRGGFHRDALAMAPRTLGSGGRGGSQFDELGLERVLRSAQHALRAEPGDERIAVVYLPPAAIRAMHVQRKGKHGQAKTFVRGPMATIIADATGGQAQDGPAEARARELS